MTTPFTPLYTHPLEGFLTRPERYDFCVCGLMKKKSARKCINCYRNNPRGGRSPIIQPYDLSIRYIPVTRGKYVIVDADNYDWLNQWKWSTRYASSDKLFYAIRIQLNNKGRKEVIFMHRFIMGLSYADGLTVDHINHDTLDNRKSNLRVATYAQNCANRRVRSDNISGIAGLSWNSLLRKWNVQITKNGVVYRPGTRKSFDEALDLYCRKNIELNGEFALLPTADEIEFAKSKRAQDQAKEDEMNSLLNGRGIATLHATGLWTVRKITENQLRSIIK
jgi:HNH endonuclease